LIPLTLILSHEGCLVSNVILRSEATKNLRVGLGITRIKPYRSETLRGVYPERSVRAQGDIIITFNTTPNQVEGRIRRGKVVYPHILYF
jgi:hypothetical protein